MWAPKRRSTWPTTSTSPSSRGRPRWCVDITVLAKGGTIQRSCEHLSGRVCKSTWEDSSHCGVCVVSLSVDRSVVRGWLSIGSFHAAPQGPRGVGGAPGARGGASALARRGGDAAAVRVHPDARLLQGDASHCTAQAQRLLSSVVFSIVAASSLLTFPRITASCFVCESGALSPLKDGSLSQHGRPLMG